MQWKLFGNRRGIPILWLSLAFPFYSFSFIKKKRGLNIGQDYKKADSLGNIYFTARDFRISGSRLIDLIVKNPAKIERLLKKCFQEGQSFIKFVDKVEKQKLEYLSRKEILKIWRDFKRKSQDFAFWMVLPQTVDKYLETYLRKKIIRPKIKKYKLQFNENDILGLIIRPHQKIFTEKEQESFLKIVQWIKKDKLSLKDSRVKSKIEKHLFLYSWANTHLWVGEGFTYQDLIKRIKENLPRIESALEEISQKEKSAKKVFDSLTKQLNLSKGERFIIKIIQTVVFIRTYRTDIYSLVGYRFRKFFNFIARQFDLTSEDFSYLMTREVEEIIKQWALSPKLKKEIKKRKKSFVYYSIKDKERIIYPQKIKERKIINQKVKGRVAYSGRVRGRAKIILRKSDLGKIKGGDILVTNMTSPDFTAVLKKVSAIITDEGGITCHAAIISREIKKPCIIGTKVATKVLKDGDFVEVDTERGAVKIIKRAK